MTDDLHPQHDLDPAVLAALDADLRSPALWAEPPASLEDDIVAAITADLDAAPAPAELVRPRWLWAVAACVLLAGGIGLGAALTNTDSGSTEVSGEVFELDPTDLAGDGSGTVELAVLGNGLWIMLDLDDVPPAPDGQFYEAWLVRSEGGIISAGTFHMRNETGSVVLWAGVTPDDGSRFAITLEDDDGDTASSGRVVLSTNVDSLTLTP